MKRNVFSYLKLIPLLALLFFSANRALGTPYYVQNSNPWGQTQNITCMNNVFGVGGWIQGNFSTPAATIFQASTQFVMLEGSDGNSGLPTFVTTNITMIENWVAAGGRLFINAAPNYGSTQNWGFGNTICQYPTFINQVTTSVPTNQIFLGPYVPTATSYTGNSFAHAWINGTGLTNLLYNSANASQPVLTYKTWGNGVVFFGGCTQPNWWTPYNPQGINLWQNIFSYVNTYPLIGINTTVTGSPWCAGANITVNYNAFNLTFTAGNQFKVQLSDALGSFASPTQIGIITSTATSGAISCTIPAAQAGGTGYRIRTVSTATAFTGADNGTNLTINPQLVPAVTISANPGNNVCAGTSVTFSASITNGGPSPSYQWKVNNVNVATTATYTSSTLNNNDQVVCVITSNAPCATPTTATSNTITMTVNPNVTPTINITANPGSSICIGQSVTFTATITNGGPTPTYVWKVNGFPVGGNAPTYTTNTLVNGDQVTCTVTGNAPCTINPTQTSNIITMTVTPNVTPTISISANPGNSVCTGTSVTYSATITNGGPTPGYSWKKNAVQVATTPTYTYTPANGDVITCDLTSTAPCATPATVSSNSITMTVTPTVAPGVSIAVSPAGPICAGTSVTFTATATNGGPTPTYVWKVNGNVSGSNSPTFTTPTLANGDVVTCTITSSSPCASPTTAVSNSITMTVDPVVVPSISISANPSNVICAGTSVTFNASATNGGPTPIYEWKKNGNPVGGNTPSYTDNALTTSDAITCTLTSNATCATPAILTSNTITMTVNPVPVPGVSISVNPGNTICSGNNTTFTATQTNGGPNPVYAWYLNGNPVGTNMPTYQNATLNSGDVVNCVLTSNALCASPTTATSNNITMTVNPTLATSVTITANPGNNVCSNVPVTFDATPVNGGPTPTYLWKVNNTPVGGNTPSYTTATLNNTDVVSCTVTSNATCATPAVTTSNFITMVITTGNVPTVNVTATPGTTICEGTSVTYTAATVYAGPSPLFQWKKNGNPVGGNSATYTDPSIVNGDVLTCTMTSSAPCVSPVTVTSSNVVMTVNNITVPGVSVASTAPGDSICLGQSVTFTANPVNGGPLPVYQWKKNGLPVGSNFPTYSDIGLVDNDVISCVLVSNDLCPVPATATSADHLMHVTPMQTPFVSVSVTPGTIICTGSTTTFNANASGVGASPVYKWMKNGYQVGGNNPTYTDLLLNEGDSVACIVLPSTSCVTAPADTSTQNVISWFNSGYLAGTIGLTESNSVKVVNTTGKINYSDCDLMVSLTPSGASPLAGKTTVKVTLDSTVKKYKGQPYLQRHFDITPDSNAANATATVTLYAYQVEFDAFNAVAATAGYPALPNYGTDNGNIKITAFHGTGTKPGNYTGAEELIIPTSVSWDVANNWWAITFPATGFSGYYIHTGNNFPLAVTNLNGNDFSMSAYPNPTQDKIAVAISGNRAAHSTLVVTDLTGRVLISSPMDNNKAIIDMSSLASGMYMLRYSDDAQSETIKITKQ